MDISLSGPVQPGRSPSQSAIDLRQYQAGLPLSGTGFVLIDYLVSGDRLAETKVEFAAGGLSDKAYSDVMNLFSLQRTITTYGQPSEIWIQTFAYSNGPRPLYVVMFYGDQGFYVDHEMLAPKPDTKDGKLVVCVAKSIDARLLMWDPGSRPKTFESFRATVKVDDRLSDESLGAQEISHARYLPIEVATGMSADTFSKAMLRGDADLCLETPRSLWVN